jgi:redox-sensing transcriptional repressor
MGNLGRAITGYFRGKRTNLNVIAAFDIDPQKVDKVVAGVKCYPIDQIRKLKSELEITIAVLTVPPDQAVTVTALLVGNGIKGIMNFTTVPLNVPDNVHLEEFDMITRLKRLLTLSRKQQPLA